MKKLSLTYLFAIAICCFAISNSFAAVTVSVFTSSANGITTPLTAQQGQTNFVPIGIQITVTGSTTSTISDLYINSDYSNPATLFTSNNIKLVRTSSSVYSAGAVQQSYNCNGNGSQLKFNVNRTYAVGTYYYFLIITPVHFGTTVPPSTITFSVSGGSGGLFNNSPSATVSGSGNGNTYNLYSAIYWYGDNSTNWGTSGAWQVSNGSGGYQNANRTPGSNDIVYIGVAPYSNNGGENPVIANGSNITVRQLIFGTTNSKTGVSPRVTMTGTTLTLNNGVSCLANATGTFLPTTSSIYLGGASDLASGSTLNFNGGATNNVYLIAGTINTTLNSTLSCATNFYNLAGAVNIGSSGSKATFNIAAGAFYNTFGGTTDIAPASVLNLTTATSSFSTNGDLTLESDATGSAAVGPITTGATISGDVNVQRFITGNNSLTYRGYRLLSSAVYDATGYYNLSFLKGSGTYLTGAANGGFDATGNPTIYLYRDNMAPSNSSFTSGNYRAVTKINNTTAYSLGTVDGNINMPVGTGFLFFFRGNNGTVSSTVPANVTLTQTGPLNTGAITVKNWTNGASTLAFSTATGNTAVKGFNLIGNPYASAINWNTHYSNSGSTDNGTGIYAPNVGHAIYIFNATTKNYSVYTSTSATTGTASGSPGGTNIIPSGQGFFVKATSAAAKIIFYESAKSASSQVTGSNLLLGAPVEAGLEQSLRLQLAKDSVNKDETVIIFNKGAKANYDENEDVQYLKGSGVIGLANLSSDKQALAINQLALPSAKQSQKIKLSVAATTDGLYTLNLTEIKNIPALYDVWLMDAYKKDSLDIKHNPTYTFNIVASDTASMGTNRFTLVIRQNAGYAYRLLDLTAKKSAGNVEVAWKAENEGDYTYFTVEKSIDGGKTFNIIASEKASAQGKYSILDKSPVIGENIYRLKQEDIDGTVTYSQKVSIEFKNIADLIIRTLTVYPNPVSNTLNLSLSNSSEQGKYSITITNSFGRVLKNIASAQASWQGDVSSFLPGTYFVKVLNEKDKSVTSSTFLKL